MPESGTLTKAHIVDAVAEANGYTRKKAIETVETVLELIKRSLESGEDVLISGFWKIQRKTKSQTKRPKSGDWKDMMLKRRRVVTFKCSGKLRDKLLRINLLVIPAQLKFGLKFLRCIKQILCGNLPLKMGKLFHNSSLQDIFKI
jgi:integration host factor subunit alpha